MFAKLKNLFWVFCILSCYPLYSIGQIWLFISNRKEDEFYDVVTKHSSDWVNAHLILMASIVLIIPAYLAINHSIKDNKNYYWANLSVFFIVLSSFVLFGQFTIDLCLGELFSLPMESAYAILDKIQANAMIQALFYDNSKLFFLFKFFDFWSLAHVCIIVALIRSGQLPKWAWIVFFAAMLLTTFGILIHPVYGRIIKRLSYSLFSVSFLPIAINLFKQAIFKR